MSAFGGVLSRFPFLRSSRGAYHRLPSTDRRHHDADLDMSNPGSGRGGGMTASRRRLAASLRASPRRLFVLTVVCLALVSTLVGGSLRARRYYADRKKAEEERKKKEEAEKDHYHWEFYPQLDGFFNGVRTLVNYTDWVPGQDMPADAELQIHESIPFDPMVVNPYPDYNSEKYLDKHYPMQTCFLDEAETHAAPDIYAYPGIPAGMAAPSFGAYEVLGVAPDRCYERFGRFGPYGYSYNITDGGSGLSTHSSRLGAEKVEAKIEKIDYRQMNWGKAQKKCFDKNKVRFESETSGEDNSGRRKLKRTAFVLRTWTGYDYSDIQMLTMRAMINELSLKSGGEYDVHLLVQVKDTTIPIWASEEIYQKTLRENVPEEFWDMATLWSEQQMRMYYPGPFPDEDNVENHSGDEVWTVYRSAHFSLQWWSQQHQEYDLVWNWEMDIRYTGHYYELLEGVSNWAAKQPRKYMWERDAMFWIPKRHGPWTNFTNMVEHQTLERLDMEGVDPIWGPVQFPTGKFNRVNNTDDTQPPTTMMNDDYQWGVGEAADFISFNPLFDPASTNWVFRDDVNGYDTSIDTPPRRAAIVTVSRLSRRLLNTLHEETWRMRHTMFPEMFPSTIALHHGYKALYAPHPVFFNRNWPLDVLDNTFNYPDKPEASPFGWGEHNLLGSTFYYNAAFSGVLWRRWLGASENDEGGPQAERDGTDRMCLRPMLHHPIKYEAVSSTNE